MNLSRIFLSTCAAAALSLGVAQAGNFSSLVSGQSYSVSVWTGKGITDQASASTQPSGTADFSFTYTGPIDFINNSSQSSPNTFGDFGFTSSNVSGLSSATLTDFLGTTMSRAGFLDNSYLSFTGIYSAGSGAVISVGHDDGASLYVDGNALFQSAGPVSYTTNSAMLPSGLHKFNLVYVESNGAPSDLVTTVPEPGSLALLGTGLIGLGVILRRRRKA